MGGYERGIHPGIWYRFLISGMMTYIIVLVWNKIAICKEVEVIHDGR
jgi:hypothetical protein